MKRPHKIDTLNRAHWLKEVPIMGSMRCGEEYKRLVCLEDVEKLLGRLVYGYRLRSHGEIESRLFSAESFKDGEAQAMGWYRNADLIPGGPAMIARRMAKEQNANARIENG